MLMVCQGNIALRLEAKQGGPSLLPQPKVIYRQPTFEQSAEVELVGKVFYEIHPQLWGQGLMSEAFSETLRFAFEEVGCTIVEVCLTRLLAHTRGVMADALPDRQIRQAPILLRSKYAPSTA